ncbi:MAG: restriction endonuclease subunit S, partial [Lachnospiraceae bacterium]|nr:restriction endonuclease subunit S [Lachnospiraceae bacterium]
MNYMMLKEVCSINMGQSPDSESYNDIGEGIPFFQGNADFGERYPITRKWCSAPTKLAAPGDILISVRAPIGAMNYAKEKCCIGRGLAALTPDETKVSPEFVFWLLKGKHAELNSKGTGSTFKAIGRKVLEETLIPDISMEQQIKYSAIIEKVYVIIQTRKLELQKLDELIKARFVEMFDLNNCKRETLGDCTDFVDYRGHTPELSDEGTIRVINA